MADRFGKQNSPLHNVIFLTQLKLFFFLHVSILYFFNFYYFLIYLHNIHLISKERIRFSAHYITYEIGFGFSSSYDVKSHNGPNISIEDINSRGGVAFTCFHSQFTLRDWLRSTFDP